MSFFPIFIELKKKTCLVVGGGRVAVRKIKILLESQAKVIVVAPQWERELEEEGRITLYKREFEKNDLEEKFLVLCATDDCEMNHCIAIECKKRNIWVNSATSKEDCTFLFPAIVRRGKAVIGVTTSGSSPVCSKYLRESIEKQLPTCLEDTLEQMCQLREYVLEKVEQEQERRKIMEYLLYLGLEKGKTLDETEVDKVLYARGEG